MLLKWWIRRLLRPWETARVLAPRLLPLALRRRLLALLGRNRPPECPPVAQWLEDCNPGLPHRSGLESGKPLVSILIVTFNNADMTRLCLRSIYGWTEYPNFEVIVVDNASTDSSAEMLTAAARQYPRLLVHFNQTNRGFAAACNQAADRAAGEILLFLNNDTVVTAGWLNSLVAALEDDSVGMVGAVSNAVANEARVRTSYATLAEMLNWAASFVAAHRDRSFAVPMLALFCAALRREVWQRVGPLDEEYGIGMFEDDDYSRRLRRAGYGLRCCQGCFVHHWQQASFKQLESAEYTRLYERNRLYYRRKWSNQ